MNPSLATIKKIFKIDPQKKALRDFRVIQKRTTSKHSWASQHWFFAKMILILLIFGLAYFQYRFYKQINQGAFQSAAEVVPVGTNNIKVDELFFVLTTERNRADVFAGSLEKGPISFDPSRYDIFLLPVANIENNDASSKVDQER